MIDTQPTVDIVLAVKDGRPYLTEQLESVLGQTLDAWRLSVRDDGSSDGRGEVLRSFAGADARIRIHPRDGRRLGPAGAYGWLLERLPDDADLVRFCDQDDVWFPDKIARSLEALPEEARPEDERPVLVHSDVTVTDDELRPVAESFWESQRFDPEPATMERLLARNFVTGHTVLANRALLSLARPIPPEAILHDWWLALGAAAFGQIVALRGPTGLYRQHGGNASGARRAGTAGEALRVLAGTWGDRRALQRDLSATFSQAHAFLERYGTQLSEADRRTVQKFVEIPECGFLRRKARIFRARTAPEDGWLRRLGILLRA